jgi:hypothetical protein
MEAITVLRCPINTHLGFPVKQTAKVWIVMVLTKVLCASPLSEAIPSYKTDGEGVDSHGVDEGPMRVAFE